MVRLAIVGIVVCIALLGCGGGGSVQSPYTGHWIGTWAENDNAWDGTFDLTIADSGSIIGTTHDNLKKVDGTVTGTMTSAGLMSITFIYPPPSIQYPASGTVSIATNGHLVCSELNEPSGGGYTDSFNINLTKH